MPILPATMTTEMLLGSAAIGADILWLIAYILIIRKGFQDRTYGVPLVALALNFTWEFMYTLQFPPSDWPHIVLRWAWLIADCVIVYQYFRFGKDNLEIPALKDHFYSASIFIFINAYVFQLTYRYHFYQPDGYDNAFLINCIMSLLFIHFFYQRSPSLSGLSYGAAWLKMVGTAILAGIYYTQRSQPMFRYSFMIYLYASTFLYDVVYVVLLATGRRKLARAAAKPDPPKPA